MLHTYCIQYRRTVPGVVAGPGSVFEECFEVSTFDAPGLQKRRKGRIVVAIGARFRICMVTNLGNLTTCASQEVVWRRLVLEEARQQSEDVAILVSFSQCLHLRISGRSLEG